MELIFSDKLRKEREKAGYSYKDMAIKLRYRSATTYMYIEKGDTIPRLDIMIAIAKIFKKPIGYFFNSKVQ